jgi:hypothetical protein
MRKAASVIGLVSGELVAVVLHRILGRLGHEHSSGKRDSGACGAAAGDAVVGDSLQTEKDGKQQPQGEHQSWSHEEVQNISSYDLVFVSLEIIVVLESVTEEREPLKWKAVVRRVAKKMTRQQRRLRKQVALTEKEEGGEEQELGWQRQQEHSSSDHPFESSIRLVQTRVDQIF